MEAEFPAKNRPVYVRIGLLDRRNAPSQPETIDEGDPRTYPVDARAETLIFQRLATRKALRETCA